MLQYKPVGLLLLPERERIYLPLHSTLIPSQRLENISKFGPIKIPQNIFQATPRNSS